MSNDSFNDLLTSDAAAFKFENVGDTCKGTVVRAEKRQQTDPDGNPRTFKSGDPMTQLVVTVDQDNGDGETAVYFKGGKFDVVDGKGLSGLDALRAAVGDQEFRPGGQIAVQYSGNGKKTNPAFSAPKLWTVQYKAPAITISADEDLF